jgi:hypothetical protein
MNSQNTTKKGIKAQLHPGKKVSLQLNADRTKYIFKSLKQNAGQHHYKYREHSSKI